MTESTDLVSAFSSAELQRKNGVVRALFPKGTGLIGELTALSAQMPSAYLERHRDDKRTDLTFEFAELQAVVKENPQLAPLLQILEARVATPA